MATFNNITENIVSQVLEITVQRAYLRLESVENLLKNVLTLYTYRVLR